MRCTPRQNTVVPDRALVAAPAQAVGDAPLPDELLEVGEIELLTERTNALLHVLNELSVEDLHVPALVAIWNAARHEDRIGVRLLSSLLEVRQSGVELLQRMSRPSQSARCCLRAARTGGVSPRFDALAECAERLMADAGVSRSMLQQQPGRVLRDLHARAEESLEDLLQERLTVDRLSWLRDMIENELQARALRLESLAERVGAYDGRRIARVLPHLTLCEEFIRDARELLARWPETDEMRQRQSALLGFLEERTYRRLTRELDATEEGRELALVLRLLPERLPPTWALLFAAATVRQLCASANGDPTPSIDTARSFLMALQLMQPDGCIRLPLEPQTARQHRKLLQRLDLQTTRSGVVMVRYDEIRHHGLMASEGIPEFVPEERRPYSDIRQLVLDNLQNEHILSGLLGNPRVVALPGLVEIVVLRTRSLKILLDIANRRDLHSGYANRNVPLALLLHPSNIPVSALRKFVHVRHVDRASLASMANRGTRVRPEIRSMASQYLKSIGNR